MDQNLQNLLNDLFLNMEIIFSKRKSLTQELLDLAEDMEKVEVQERKDSIFGKTVSCVGNVAQTGGGLATLMASSTMTPMIFPFAVASIGIAVSGGIFSAVKSSTTSSRKKQFLASLKLSFEEEEKTTGLIRSQFEQFKTDLGEKCKDDLHNLLAYLGIYVSPLLCMVKVTDKNLKNTLADIIPEEPFEFFNDCEGHEKSLEVISELDECVDALIEFGMCDVNAEETHDERSDISTTGIPLNVVANSIAAASLGIRRDVPSPTHSATVAPVAQVVQDSVVVALDSGAKNVVMAVSEHTLEEAAAKSLSKIICKTASNEVVSSAKIIEEVAQDVVASQSVVSQEAAQAVKGAIAQGILERTLSPSVKQSATSLLETGTETIAIETADNLAAYAGVVAGGLTALVGGILALHDGWSLQKAYKKRNYSQADAIRQLAKQVENLNETTFYKMSVEKEAFQTKRK